MITGLWLTLTDFGLQIGRPRKVQVLLCALSSAQPSWSKRFESPLRTADAADVLEGRNLFARQSRFDLIKLPETIALHAYATII